MKKIQNTLPFISEQTKQNFLKGVTEILDSGNLILGQYTKKLEETTASYVGVKYAVAVSDATSAVQMILEKIGVRGYEVIFPTNTFISPVYAAQQAGAKIGIVDIQLQDYNIDFESLKAQITSDTKAVIVTHIAGTISPDIWKIKALCQENNITLIEDASHAYGAELDGIKAGAIGDIGIFSLYATKVVTAGTGGLITTNDEALYDYCQLARHHGNYGPMNQVLAGDSLISEMNALLGYLQAQEIEENLLKRQKIRQYYQEHLSAIFEERDIQFQEVASNVKSTFYKMIISSKNTASIAQLSEALLKKDIRTGHCYKIPLHQQPTLTMLGMIAECPNGDNYGAMHLSLPCHLNLTTEDLQFIVTNVKEALNE
ncbi:DegT/DnrJ/EryC1/StrS family aminotransferase [Listeria booriae]|uniref:DegT/DnrJ/EryC1/StrS family aminotransferase n=1 Tax=Listeria booriae TaxID=1552123 RepID=UPI0016293DA0|nr:DegT/DnrJ/EryC1/StrS family aminotransferase [Listeria booriae]MBC2324174.1 DegT/DnrJ/EryC1/StrS family aminotransferase [Listeria booriae]MBC2327817.1 DegT/DnrJ/EryC1/StrS family aminotransferase [Listeria booriae]MCD2208035.1 DegT/DnrJ/EryC1/StrS family aminotransferase [Listeria booriae]